MTAMTRPALLVALLLALGATSCGSDDDATEPDPLDATRDYLLNTWGISMTGFESWDGDHFQYAADGTATAAGEGIIRVRGLGEAEVSVIEIVSPASAGGITSLVVRLADGSSERSFEYWPEYSSIAFGGDEEGVAIDANPDGTYDVFVFDEDFPFLDGEPATAPVTVPDGMEALSYLRTHGDIDTVSPYVFLFAFALAHSPTLEARATFAVRSSNLAAQPVVCELFRDFCDCAACFVLDRAGACDVCPAL